MSNWVEVNDPKTGKKYYYDKVTKQTKWTRPDEMGEPTQDATDKEEHSNNPKNWAEGKDPKSGKTYYYNKKTRETTWKVPQCLKDAGGVSAGSSAASKDKGAQGDWREATDPKSGKKYWYNKATKKTTWKNPHEAAGAGAGASSPKAAAPAAAATTTASATKPAANDDDDESGSDTLQRANQQMKLKQAMQDQTVEEDKANEDDDEEGEHDFKFAKHRHGWVNRTFRTGEIHNEEQLLTFKKSMIKKALLKQNRDLDIEAVQSFKNVMSYMGDRKSSKPPVDHARKLLRNIMVLPIGIRDELYMQLCKQTTQNPRIASTIKGWELMVFCVATFPPSKALKAFLMDFIQRTINENINQKITALAKVCHKNLAKIVLMGQRKQVPSKQELTCLIECNEKDATSTPVKIRVYLCNGMHKTFEADSYTLVSDITDQLVEKYNLVCYEPFAMYEQAESNVERILDPKDRILDVLASWENREFNEEVEVEQKVSKRKTQFDKHKDQNKKIKKVEVEYNQFVYKAKLVLKTSNKDIMGDEEAVNLIYIQAVQDVVTSRYPSQDKDITVLAALQLQATFDDFNPDQHVAGWLAPKITEYMPMHLLTKKQTKDPTTIQDHLVKEWEMKILAKYKCLKGFTMLDAKLNYLDYVQEWTFYGATFFEVEQRQFKDYPSPLTLGINCEGVLLMHPEKQTVLENYQFTDIVTWGHSDEKFIVVVGNILQQRKLIFKTNDGKHMNHLIHDYVKFKVKQTS